MKVIRDTAEMKGLAAAVRGKGGTVVVVPTMGALHRGHVELLRLASRAGTFLVLTIFVNPAQFGPDEDLDAYPRDMEADLKIARAEGVDVVFNPAADEMYGEGYETYVEVERLSKKLCGAVRPGHFRGVATVVLKLFNITMAQSAVFGKKDFQQLVIIKRMIRDLNMDVEIIEAETVRDDDGLALSSRNRYLDPDDRRAAACIPRALEEARKAFGEGERESADIIRTVKEILGAERLLNPEYIKICDPETLEDIARIEEGKRALVALAVRVGPARLIDNVLL